MTRLVKVMSGMKISPEHGDKLKNFRILFQKWNKSINLSAARSEAEIEEHLVDSLQVVPYLTEMQRVVDVGSGGGFPVVIAAICLPATNFTALEPVHKKHAFLRTAARELDLVNLEAFARRVEDHDTRDYDAACSRATFDLPLWFTHGLELVRPGGTVIGFEAMRRDDLPAAVERHPYELEGKTRAIVLVRRPAAT